MIVHWFNLKFKKNITFEKLNRIDLSIGRHLTSIILFFYYCKLYRYNGYTEKGACAFVETVLLG